MAKSTRLVILDLASDRDQEYIYSMGSETFFACYILSDESSILRIRVE